MSNGLIFYWLAWILWIIITFFMESAKQRTFLASWIMVLILLSNTYITIGEFSFSASYFVLFAVTICLHARISRTMHHVFISFTIMIGYTGMFIWGFSTPLGHFLPQLEVTVCLLVLLATLLAKGFWNKLITCLTGISGGEWLYSFILNGYSFQDIIGDMRFFDIVFLLTAALTLQDLLLKLKLKFKNMVFKASSKPKALVKKKAQ
ncbi:YphA family membrane protein [Lentibacillus cibarius]|uniref:Uncharacterized protein n=1 Tax=Lentibacillus cibarius TaxID=2583219 RepID=A0A5S3QFM4_9BACI|nr:hypothetical protein [Lentibacillus cibarius]TMN20692.1 hypothetical protein FFL34_00130 [Lentibacillus cibarius]